MSRSSLALVAPLLLLSLASRAADDAARTYPLAPAYRPGQRWTTSWELVLKTRTLVMGETASRGHGLLKEEGAYDVRVSEAAAGGAVGKASVEVGDAKRTRDPVMGNAETLDLPGSRQHLFVEPKPAKAADEALAVTTVGGEAAEERAAAFAANVFRATLARAEPARVGERWGSSGVAAVFGPEARGAATLVFARVERTDAGRDVAVLDVTGGTARVGGAGENDPSTAFAFTGTVRVDLAERVVASVSLSGTGEITTPHGGGLLGRGIEKGEFTFESRTTFPKPDVPAPPRPAPPPRPTVDTPRPPPPPLAVDPRDDALTGPAAYRHPQGLYDLTVPEGWALRAEEGATIVRMTHAATGAVVAVLVRPLEGGAAATAEAFYRRSVKPGLHDDVVAIAEEAAQRVGGRDGFGVAYATRATGDRQLQLFAVTGGHALVFYAKAPDAAFERAKPDLRKVRESFAVHDPPRPPAGPGPRGGLKDW